MARVFVYVLQSETDGSFYIGITSRLRRRLKEHNAGLSRATKSKRPWRLVYREEFANHEEARHREKQLKSGRGRRWLAEQLRTSRGSPEGE
jgi:putative endonuclease